MKTADKNGETAGLVTGWIWDIKKYAIHDGPGIRTTVFLKGCPLRCVWCCNPESQEFRTELLWIAENCDRCGRCLDTCPLQAVSEDEQGKKRIDWSRCDLCGRCLSACPNGALRLMGRQVTVNEVLREVTRDAVFYQRSGGGLTLTGGEPSAQPEFAAELLRRYKTVEGGRHTTVETCGFADWTAFSRLLEYTDLVLYDIKHMDPECHLKLTGVDHELILGNARRIAGSGRRLVIRFPLVPGINDHEDNVRSTAAFARSLAGVEEIDILPYHRLGEPKYSRLGRESTLKGTPSPNARRLNEIAALIESYGLHVKIGG